MSLIDLIFNNWFITNQSKMNNLLKTSFVSLLKIPKYNYYFPNPTSQVHHRVFSSFYTARSHCQTFNQRHQPKIEQIWSWQMECIFLINKRASQSVSWPIGEMREDTSTLKPQSKYMKPSKDNSVSMLKTDTSLFQTSNKLSKSLCNIMILYDLIRNLFWIFF